MRLTVLDDDPGIRIYPGQRYKVYLDGEEVKSCFTADDENGEVIAAVLDEHDRMIAENGEVKWQTLFGTVRIKKQ
jgi:hypothetical protein